MRTKNNNPYKLVKNKKLDPIIEVYFQINHLKHLFRQGWLLRGIPENKCESVGDHCFAVSLFAVMIAEKYFPRFDAEKVMKMALIHDIGEIYAGDITPYDGVSVKEKHARERRSIEKLFLKFPERKEYFKLWKEYDSGKTQEAKFVKQIDKLEMALQASVYSLQYRKDLSEFVDSARENIKDKKILEILDELKKL